MLGLVMKRLASGVSAACLLACASVVHAGTITIYAAANFEDALTQLTADYQTYVDPTANFNVTYGATATLQATIIALGNSGSGQADIFLAANTAAPANLYDNYNSLVTGSPFNYAQGYLMLWSNTTGVDLSGGLPNPFNTAFVIANPTTAPYGTAAQQLMAGSPWNYTSPIPGGYVYESTNIATTYNVVANGTFAYGFVAKSQVCTYDGTNYYFTGTSYHEYDSGYTPLVQAGIVIKRTGQDTDLTNGFVSFLSSSQGLADIEYFCYTIPSSDFKKAEFMKPKGKLLLPEHAKHPLFPAHLVQHPAPASPPGH